MIRTYVTAFALVTMALAMPMVAAAQAPNPIGVTLRAGPFFPLNSNARSNATVWPAIGGEMRFMSLGTKSYTNNWLSVSVDWMGRGNWSQTPVLVNYVSHSGQVFFDAGAGVGFASEPSSSGTDFAYQAGIGYEFPTTSPSIIFVEAKYWGSDRTELDGFAAYIGVRF